MNINPRFEELYKQHFGPADIYFYRPWEYSWVVSQLEPLSGMTVLDAGTGKSALPLFLAEHGARVFTVDNGSPRDKGKQWGYFDYGAIVPGIISYHLDFSELSCVTAAQMDAVTCVSVIEHIPASKRRAALKEFRRILEYGKKLVLTVDLKEDGFGLWNKCRSVLVEPDSMHGTVSSLIEELRGFGFILQKYEECPLRNERKVRVVGMTLQTGEGWYVS